MGLSIFDKMAQNYQNRKERMNEEQRFKVTGMDCAGCAQSVETGVRQLSGVSECSLNFTTETLRVSGMVTREAIVKRVESLGFGIAEPTAATPEAASPSSNFFHYMWQRADTRLALIGAILILPGVLFAEFAGQEHWLIDLTSIGAMVVAGGPIARSAWRAVSINREININVLMTMAAIGAVIIGAYTEAGMVMVLFAIGEALEGYTANRARQAIQSLMSVVPKTATRLRCCDNDPQEERVSIEQLHVGDVILVKPGEQLPMDGRVRAGASHVNQAPITGESKLVEKQVGSEVFASTLNGEGVLEVEVTHLAQDNTISRLIQMVSEAQERRAPSQRFIDQFAKYYTPAVVILAVLVATIPPLFFGQPFFNPNEESFGWLYRSLALLVVACPCALVISTPVSIISGISNAAMQGVLIKGGVYLEQLSQIRAMAFDKTGTLTLGQPSVVDLRAMDCPTPTEHRPDCGACNDLLALAASVERRSEHPLAQAIINAATTRHVQDNYPAAQMTQAIVGQGVRGQVNGQTVLIGSHTYFDQAVPHAESICQAATMATEQGHTPLLVARAGEYVGTITVADQVRPSSREAVAQLKQAGLRALIMLTGDNRVVAAKIAQAVGVTDVRAELLPENKVDAVRGLQAEYGKVAMIGDGINDAPALATADVGIAIGGLGGGTAQAMETADITLMQDDLRRLPFVFGLSRQTMQTIWVNVGLSIGIKLAFVGLTVVGLSTMWMAVLADMGTSLLVTLNGMRLLRYRA